MMDRSQYLFQHARLETARANVEATRDDETDPHLVGRLDYILKELNYIMAMVLMKYNNHDTYCNTPTETTRC